MTTDQMIEDYGVLKTRASMMRLELKHIQKLYTTMQTEIGDNAFAKVIDNFVESIDLLEDAAALIDADELAPAERNPYSMTEFVKVGGSV